MGKRSYLRSGRYLPGPTLDENNQMTGAFLAPGSVGPQVGSYSTLSAITAILGTVYSGTLYAGADPTGENGGSRAIIGDAADGIILEGTSGRKWFAAASSLMKLRIGLDGTPGLDVTAGLLDIHGGAIRAHTITTDRLNLPGPLTSTLLTNDMLLIGQGVWGTNFTGFAAGYPAIGGYNAQVPAWQIDRQTGRIISYAAGETLEDYIAIAGGVVSWSATESLLSGFDVGDVAPTLPATTMDLRRYVVTLDENGEPIGNEVYHTYIDGVLNGVLVRGDRATTYPYFSLVNSALESGAYLGEGLLRLRKHASDQSLAHAWATLQAIPEADVAGEDAGRVEMRGLGAVRLYWGGTTVEGVPADAQPYITPSALGLRVAGGGIEFQPAYDSTGSPWYPGVATPGGTAQPTGFYLGPDPYGNGELYYRDAFTGKWYTIDKTEVS